MNHKTNSKVRPQNYPELSQTVILCTPSKAEELGYTLTTTKNLTKTEAKNMRDYFEAIETHQQVAIDFIVGLLLVNVSYLFASVAAIGTDMLYNIIQEYIESNSDIADDIATSESTFKVKLTYKYKRHGSSSGAYFLNKIEII